MGVAVGGDVAGWAGSGWEERGREWVRYARSFRRLGFRREDSAGSAHRVHRDARESLEITKRRSQGPFGIKILNYVTCFFELALIVHLVAATR